MALLKRKKNQLEIDALSEEELKEFSSLTESLEEITRGLVDLGIDSKVAKDIKETAAYVTSRGAESKAARRDTRLNYTALLSKAETNRNLYVVNINKNIGKLIDLLTKLNPDNYSTKIIDVMNVHNEIIDVVFNVDSIDKSINRILTTSASRGETLPRLGTSYIDKEDLIAKVTDVLAARKDAYERLTKENVPKELDEKFKMIGNAMEKLSSTLKEEDRKSYVDELNQLLDKYKIAKVVKPKPTKEERINALTKELSIIIAKYKHEIETATMASLKGNYDPNKMHTKGSIDDELRKIEDGYADLSEEEKDKAWDACEGTLEYKGKNLYLIHDDLDSIYHAVSELAEINDENTQEIINKSHEIAEIIYKYNNDYQGIGLKITIYPEKSCLMSTFEGKNYEMCKYPIEKIAKAKQKMEPKQDDKEKLLNEYKAKWQEIYTNIFNKIKALSTSKDVVNDIRKILSYANNDANKHYEEIEGLMSSLIENGYSEDSLHQIHDDIYKSIIIVNGVDLLNVFGEIEKVLVPLIAIYGEKDNQKIVDNAVKFENNMIAFNGKEDVDLEGGVTRRLCSPTKYISEDVEKFILTIDENTNDVVINYAGEQLVICHYPYNKIKDAATEVSKLETQGKPYEGKYANPKYTDPGEEREYTGKFEQPAQPAQPVEPVKPAQPAQPVEPVKPAKPAQPVEPVHKEEKPAVVPAEKDKAAKLSKEEAQDLEEYVNLINSINTIIENINYNNKILAFEGLADGLPDYETINTLEPAIAKQNREVYALKNELVNKNTEFYNKYKKFAKGLTKARVNEIEFTFDLEKTMQTKDEYIEIAYREIEEANKELSSAVGTEAADIEAKIATRLKYIENTNSYVGRIMVEAATKGKVDVLELCKKRRENKIAKRTARKEANKAQHLEAEPTPIIVDPILEPEPEPEPEPKIEQKEPEFTGEDYKTGINYRIEQKGLKLKSVQKVGAPLFRGFDSITTKIMDRNIEIIYNNSLRQRLKDIKAKLVLLKNSDEQRLYATEETDKAIKFELPEGTSIDDYDFEIIDDKEEQIARMGR